MQSYLSVNIAKYDTYQKRHLHYLEIRLDHLLRGGDREAKFALILAKFPESEGFAVTATVWRGIGERLPMAPEAAT